MARKELKKKEIPGTRSITIPPFWSYVLLAAVLLFFAFIRFRLKDLPLERDEGEYAYMGQLMLQGVAPYQLAYNMKLPGTYAAYAGILAIFGQTPSGIHLGLLLLNAGTSLMVFLLGRRLFGNLAGIASGSCYALLSTSSSVLGFAGHATHFVVFPATAGILLLLQAMEKRGKWLLLLSGAVLGLAFLMKQPGAFFIVFGFAYLLYSELGPGGQSPERKSVLVRAVFFIAGALIPYLITCALLLAAGVFDRFWFWTVSYAGAYGSQLDLSDGLTALSIVFPHIVAHTSLIWLLALAGLTAPLWNRESRPHAFFVAAFAVFSFLSVTPGLYFRNHYWILFLPAVSLLAGLALSSLARVLSGKGTLVSLLPAATFVLAAGYSVSGQSEVYFDADPLQVCRMSYGSSPFPESQEIGRYLAQHTSRDARIAVLGSEPQIYFYSGRKSATGYIYVYPLMELHKYAAQMQQEMIREIENSRPAYIVFVRNPVSWMSVPQSVNLLIPWAQKYLTSQYDLEGISDATGNHAGTFYLGEEAKSYRNFNNTNVMIYRRKT